VVSDGVVIHERLYAHPPDRVWRALVDPEELSRWLMSSDFVPAVGHTFTAWWLPLGHIDATVVGIERPWQLTCLWEGSFGQTLVSFRLSAENGGTRLRIEHSVLGDSHTAGAPVARRPCANSERRSGRTVRS
jgi:uncharacterized protein YndB with AHSA1/START domain